MKEIEVEVVAAAEPAELWDLLAAVSTWAHWASFDEASIESGHELGEIRRFHEDRSSVPMAGLVSRMTPIPR